MWIHGGRTDVVTVMTAQYDLWGVCAQHTSLTGHAMWEGAISVRLFQYLCISDRWSCNLYFTPCINEQYLLLMLCLFIVWGEKYDENYNHYLFQITSLSSGHKINHSLDLANF
jgi:hypothetical protein